MRFDSHFSSALNLLLLLLCPGVAVASQTISDIQKSGQKARDGAVRLSCDANKDGGIQGIVCPYYRANDNLTFQAMYLLEKVKKIDDAIRNGDEDEARTALGTFCQTGQGETLSACSQRYKSFQTMALVRIREAIVANEDAIARLSLRRTDEGKVEGGVHRMAFAVETETYTPEVIKLSELEAEYQKAKKSGKVKVRKGRVVEDHGRWKSEVVNPIPTKEHYVFGKEVDADPGNSDSRQKLTMYDRKGGSLQTDSKVEKLMTAKKKELLSSKTASGVETAQEITPVQLSQGQDRLSYEAFQETRRELVGALEGKMRSDHTPKGAQNVQVSRGQSAQSALQEIDNRQIQRPSGLTGHYYLKYNLNQLWQEIQGL